MTQSLRPLRPYGNQALEIVPQVVKRPLLTFLSPSCRYVAIVHPLKPQLRRTHARLMILPVWAISLVLVSPYMASLDIKDGECVEDFQSAGMDPKYYTIGVFITQYVVPLAIIAFSYIR